MEGLKVFVMVCWCISVTGTNNCLLREGDINADAEKWVWEVCTYMWMYVSMNVNQTPIIHDTTSNDNKHVD